MTARRFISVLALLAGLLPITLGAQARVSGSLSSATCPGTGCITISVSGQGSVGVQITGTWSGTITFEGSVDGLNYQAVTVFPTNTTTGTSTTTGNGVWSTSIGGLTIFRARMSAYTSGTANVTMGIAAARASSGGGGGGGGGAPTDATYIVQTPDATLSAEQALSALSSGLLRGATTTGVVTSINTSAGLLANISDATGTGLAVFGTSPTFLTNIDLEATGVRLSAADGVMTILGRGNGLDYALTFDLDNGASSQIVVGGGGTGASEFSWDPGAVAQVAAGTDNDGNYVRMNRSATVAEVWGQTNSGVEFFQLRSATNIGSLTVGTSVESVVVSASNTTALIDLGAAGVRASAADGVLTFLGRGNGNDENLTIDLDNATANTIALASSTGATTLTWNGSALLTAASLPAYNLTFSIDGGGAVITTGFKGCTNVPQAGTVLSWAILSDDPAITSGSMVVDVWEDTMDNYAPTDADSITAAAPPTLTTATNAFSSTLTGWSTAFVNGGTAATTSTVCFNVDSVTALLKANVVLRVQP